jgi:hypothetical protein
MKILRQHGVHEPRVEAEFGTPQPLFEGSEEFEIVSGEGLLASFPTGMV